MATSRNMAVQGYSFPTKTIFYCDSALRCGFRGNQSAFNYSKNCCADDNSGSEECRCDETAFKACDDLNRGLHHFGLDGCHGNRSRAILAGQRCERRFAEGNKSQNSSSTIAHSSQNIGYHGNLVATETTIVVHGPVGKVIRSHAVIENVGTSVIRYCWVVSVLTFFFSFNVSLTHPPDRHTSSTGETYWYCTFCQDGNKVLTCLCAFNFDNYNH